VKRQGRNGVAPVRHLPSVARRCPCVVVWPASESTLFVSVRFNSYLSVLRILSRRFLSTGLALACFICLASLSASPSSANRFAAFGPKPYVRQKGAPITVADAFSVADTSVHYSLRVTNSKGAKGDEEDDSQASITLNGCTVLDSTQFGNAVSVIQVAVPLAVSNTIAIRVLGPDGGKITVEIIGGMVGTFSVLGPNVYQGGDEGADLATDTFSVPDTSSHYILRATNSGLPTRSDKRKSEEGRERDDGEGMDVARASIRINGVEVVDRRRFGDTVATFEALVLVQVSNQISVVVKGGDGGKITQEIEGGLMGLFTVFGAKEYQRGTGAPDNK
jgi:hypothetical protein